MTIREKRATAKKDTAAGAVTLVQRRLRAIEKEIADLKNLLANKRRPKKPPELYGILKGEEFSEEEIDEIGRSIFREADAG